MTVLVKIMVDEALPRGSVKVVPRIIVTAASEADLRKALGAEHKIAYCPSVEVGERVRAVIAKTEGVEEL